MLSVAVIPARGGSKRIPRKNIKFFLGKPMIAYSIEVAFASKMFDRVIVSTDDAEIREVALNFGAEVPFLRPNELSDDYATTTDVVAHTVDWLRSVGVVLSAVCCIYATAPFVQSTDLIRSKEIFDEGEWDFVFAATSFGFPIFRSIERNPSGGVRMLFPEHFQTRSQDLSEVYHDAGQFYWGKPDSWVEKKRIFDEWSSFVDLPRWRVQDIDTMEDWKRAEVLFQLLAKSV